MQAYSFLWHDYETFGAVPRKDRPAQFAAIRTDAELNEIGEPFLVTTGRRLREGGLPAGVDIEIKL